VCVRRCGKIDTRAVTLTLLLTGQMNTAANYVVCETNWWLSYLFDIHVSVFLLGVGGVGVLAAVVPLWYQFGTATCVSFLSTRSCLRTRSAPSRLRSKLDRGCEESKAAVVLYCAKCSKTGESLLKCSGCDVARYCSAGTCVCMCVRERGECVMCGCVCVQSASAHIGPRTRRGATR
jgi:hypothetical protein